MIELTKREKQLLKMWLYGATSFGIADRLRITREEVLDLMKSVELKLDLDPIVVKNEPSNN